MSPLERDRDRVSGGGNFTLSFYTDDEERCFLEPGSSAMGRENPWTGRKSSGGRESGTGRLSRFTTSSRTNSAEGTSRPNGSGPTPHGGP